MKNKIRSILFIVVCMTIGAVINSLIYEKERAEWYEEKQKKLLKEWDQVNATHEQVDSIMNEARDILYDLKNKY